MRPTLCARSVKMMVMCVLFNSYNCSERWTVLPILQMRRERCGEIQKWRRSGYATPKYIALVWWSFQAEGIWETVPLWKVLQSSLFCLKKEQSFPGGSCPRSTRKRRTSLSPEMGNRHWNGQSVCANKLKQPFSSMNSPPGSPSHFPPALCPSPAPLFGHFFTSYHFFV